MRFRPGEIPRRLRTAAVMAAAGFVLLFLTSREIIPFGYFFYRILHPFYLYVFTTVLGILAITFLFPSILAALGSWPLRAVVLVIMFGVLVLLPYLLVVLLGESGSRFWYLVYGLFIPSGLLISAHWGLMVVSLRQRGGRIEPLFLGPAAFIGSLAAPIVTLMPYYGHRLAVSLGAVAFLLFVLTLVSDVGLVGWASRRPSRTEFDEPDL